MSTMADPFGIDTIASGASSLVSSIFGSKAQEDAAKANEKLLKIQGQQQAQQYRYLGYGIIGLGAIVLSGILLYGAVKGK